jgi:hypothetical protein
MSDSAGFYGSGMDACTIELMKLAFQQLGTYAFLVQNWIYAWTEDFLNEIQNPVYGTSATPDSIWNALFIRASGNDLPAFCLIDPGSASDYDLGAPKDGQSNYGFYKEEYDIIYLNSCQGGVCYDPTHYYYDDVYNGEFNLCLAEDGRCKSLSYFQYQYDQICEDRILEPTDCRNDCQRKTGPEPVEKYCRA